MRRWIRARTARTIAALFALSLTLSACHNTSLESLLELLGGTPGAQPPAEAAPAPDDEEPAPDDEEPAPDDEEPAPDDEEPAPDDEDASADLSEIEQEIFGILNATRADAGLDELSLSADIAAGAREYSCEMAETGVFEHDDLAEAGVGGENIATGQRSAAQVHEGWMDSPGHRENRMNDRWSEYGVGVCEDDGGRLYFTERFN